mmetsp:Transcript_35622/g.101493  ORF Transcript_35622/g.101493 Transcript_35622/m.101493 type:complete len:322 (-) Transcript_35622:699-1664(-)
MNLLAGRVGDVRTRYRLHNTFLDLDAPGVEGSAARRSKSEASAKQLQTRTPPCSDEHRYYVSDLTPRMAQLWERIEVLRRHAGQPSAFELMGIFDRHDSADPVMSQRSVRHEVPYKAHWWGGAHADHSGLAPTILLEPPPADRPRPLLASLDRAAYLGSTGHPELCTKPCLHAAAGRCANGDSCSFCHMPHPNKAKHLDKRDREALRMMPLLDAQLLLLPILREKVLAVDASAEVAQELQRVLSTCGLGGSPRRARQNAHSRRIISGARHMTLRHLMVVIASLAQRAGSDDIPTAIESLLDVLLRGVHPSAHTGVFRGGSL